MNGSLSNKIVAVIMFLSLIFGITVQSYAHSAMLGIYYDDCGYDNKSNTHDDINESWYYITRDDNSYHLSHEEETIKYYFSETSIDGTHGWTNAVSPAITDEEANNIKLAYANSMKKWNNVYYYSYDNSGNITKHKIINVVEGTENDHNLIIYPKSGNQYIAYTKAIDGKVPIEGGSVTHNHYSEWLMNVYVYYFSSLNTSLLNNRAVILERNGAHELGHVLGLFDVDAQCNKNESEDDYHHHESLMGYGSPLDKRSYDIQYIDIAGVAITRGFHTDDDHKWLNAGIQENGTYKLICSICNGVKYVESLSGISYSTYGYCNSNHDLSDGNMMAVASYGNSDYYKCKYCRYVAPFSDIVPQDYEITYISETYHQYQNMVDGLEYTMLKPHIINENYCSICQSNIHFYTHQYVSYSNYAHKAFCECGEYILEDHLRLAPSYDCVLCGDEHTHTYGRSYEWVSDKIHTTTCVCGEIKSEGHVVSATALPIHGRKVCLLCGGLASEGYSQMAVGSLPHTENGSYITSDGITVLVDEDIEAFLNGTLEFIYPSVGETS